MEPFGRCWSMGKFRYLRQMLTLKNCSFGCLGILLLTSYKFLGGPFGHQNPQQGFQTGCLNRPFRWGQDREYLTFDTVFQTDGPQNLRPLPDFLPTLRSMFFLETSGSSSIEGKTACSVESAALHHPDNLVQVLMTSEEVDLSSVQHLLRSYRNIRLRHLHVPSFVEGTPAQVLWSSSKMQGSSYYVAHVSDVLRFLLLWKFGGTYLDTDVMLLRPLPDEQTLPNFVVFEDSDLYYLAIGVMRLQLGQPVSEMLVRQQTAQFNEKEYSINGPRILTDVVNLACHTHGSQNMSPEKCLGIKTLPHTEFYAVPPHKWRDYFSPFSADSVLGAVNGSIGIHTWGFHSSNVTVTASEHAQSPYGVLARMNCPETAKHIFGFLTDANLSAWTGSADPQGEFLDRRNGFEGQVKLANPESD